MGDLIGLVAVSAPFLMVFGIVWLTQQKKLEEKRIAATAEASSEKAAQYASQVTQLEDRVRVLERIVTDKGYNVASQIEALRDQRRVDEAGSGTQLDFAKREEV